MVSSESIFYRIINIGRRRFLSVILKNKQKVKKRIASSQMPHRRRSKPYHLRDHQIDPLLTYDGIKTNPLPYIDTDIHPIDNNSLCLAELYFEHWNINNSTEEIFLHDPFLFCDNDENIYLKNHLHPLKWLYDLIRNNQLYISYSPKQCTLTLIYSLSSSDNKTSKLNLFIFYTYCKENDKTNCFFKHLFTFDDYQSISKINHADKNAINIIDFIYQEIQATTMIDINQNNIHFQTDSLLKNDVIQLKDHQIKSSKIYSIQCFFHFFLFFMKLIGCLNVNKISHQQLSIHHYIFAMIYLIIYFMFILFMVYHYI